VFSELKGNTLRVYLCLVENRAPMSVREIQKKLEFSSPTLAAYHMEKLEGLALVHKTSGGYAPTREIKIGALSQVIKFGSLLLPRYIFYLALFSVMLGCYLFVTAVERSFTLNFDSGFAILLGVSAIAVMAYECFRTIKQKPI